MKRNPTLNSLKTNYLFPEINLRKKQFLSDNPGVSLISLGVGDTTEPIPQSISQALVHSSSRLGTCDGYSGYGPEQGIQRLREKIASQIYKNQILSEEVFVSDGAKCDLGRLQMLFGCHVSIAVQDPSYPVYIDGSLIQGVENIAFMRCTPENDFFPDLATIPRTDLIYFCSPNNPTGAVATKKQLEDLVNFAQNNRSIIIYDSAYSNYIQDPSLPKSIFEIDGAKNVAIEINSFSKLAGFTGIRLGWTVIPKELRYDNGFSVWSDWNRMTTTIFNGASNIAQYGGCAALEPEGLIEINALADFYMENASILRKTFQNSSHKVFGGLHAPYLWVNFKDRNSWDTFHYLLEKCHILTTPGSGFGPAGEGFIRLSAFGKRENILQAVERLKVIL